MIIKITTGHYHNITYLIDEKILFDSNLKVTDIDFIGGLEFKIDENKLKQLLIQGNTILGIYRGKSRVDNSPIFSIDLTVEIRESVINEILKA